MTVKRPMLWISAAFVAGMYLFALFGASLTYTVIFCAVVAAIIKAVKKRKWYDNIILFIAFTAFTAGALYYGFADDLNAKELFPYCDKTVVLTGEALEKPKVLENYISFPFQVSTIKTEEGKTETMNEKVSFIYFLNEKSDETFSIPMRGDVIKVSCVISTPMRAKNKGGFDYAQYLKTQDVFFQARADGEYFLITGHNSHPVSDFIYTLRNHCASLFRNTFPESESGVLSAYVLGDKTEIDETVSEIFSASGLSHVLAVSGMHVTVLLSVITGLLTLIRLSKRKQLVLLLCTVVFFVLFTGASVSAVRAGFVCFLAIFAQLIYKRSDPVTALMEAAFVLCLINPMVILSASFMLSFSATLGILLFTPGMSERLSFVYKKIRVTSKARKFLKTICDLTAVGISAQLFTIPVLIYVFQVFSTMSVVATLIITPILAPLLAGGLLFCVVASISTALATPIAGFVYLLAKCMIVIADVFAKIPVSQIPFGKITPFLLLCYVVFLLLIYFALIRINRKGCCITLYSLALLLIIFLCHVSLQNPIAEVSFINVGQGDCTLIRAPGNCDILIDAGGSEEDDSIGEKTVKPYLIQKGVYDIEYAIASHGHIDHIGGLIGLLDVMEIKKLVVPVGFGNTEESKMLLEKAKAKHVPVIYMQHGDVLQLGNDIALTAVLPDEKILALSASENDRSLLLKLTYGKISFLFPGDLSSVGEGYVANRYPKFIAADVIKAPHHGSKAASSDLFLDTVKPKYAYIPVGQNRYGHPGKEVMQRYFSRGISYYRADKEGDITFYFDANAILGIQ